MANPKSQKNTETAEPKVEETQQAAPEAPVTETPQAPTAPVAPKPYEVQHGPAPEPEADGRNSRGFTAMIRGLAIGDWFQVPRKAGDKRDTSKAANIVAICKKYEIGMTRYRLNATTDIYKRIEFVKEDAQPTTDEPKSE